MIGEYKKWVSKYKFHFQNGDIVSIEETRKLLNDPEKSEEELEQIRDGFRYLSEVIVDNYIFSKNQNSQFVDATLEIIK